METILKTNEQTNKLAFTNYLGFSGAVPVFTLKVPWPGKPLRGDTLGQSVTLGVF